MSTFELYFKLGLDHILDIAGFDHMMFIIVLCAVYTMTDWQKVLILVTAFTIGHSITLALATLKIVSVNAGMVEFLIPLTILLTSLANIFFGKPNGKFHLNYFLAGFFGLIHGLGFSNNLRSLLGSDDSILVQLLAFNIGIEIGQIIIVLIFLVISWLFIGLINTSRRDWRMVISSFGGGIALYMILQQQYF